MFKNWFFWFYIVRYRTGNVPLTPVSSLRTNEIVAAETRTMIAGIHAIPTDPQRLRFSVLRPLGHFRWPWGTLSIEPSQETGSQQENAKRIRTGKIYENLAFKWVLFIYSVCVHFQRCNGMPFWYILVKVLQLLWLPEHCLKTPHKVIHKVVPPSCQFLFCTPSHPSISLVKQSTDYLANQLILSPPTYHTPRNKQHTIKHNKPWPTTVQTI